MLRQHSHSIVSRNPSTLLSLSHEKSILDAERKKVVAYLAARIILGNARSKVDMKASNGWHLYAHLQSKLFIHFDHALQELPEQVFVAVLQESILEAIDLFKVTDVTEEVDDQFLMLIDNSIGSKAHFQAMIQNALQDNMTKDTQPDISNNSDMKSMAEMLHTLVKCGAIASFRKIITKMGASDRDHLIEKFGAGMLRYAIQFRQIEFVKELLHYNIDINHLVFTAWWGSSNSITTSSLNEALSRTLADCVQACELHKSLHERTASFFETSEYMKDYKMPSYQKPDLAKRFKDNDTIITLLLAHGADADVPEYTYTPLSSHKQSAREICLKAKPALLSANGDVIEDPENGRISIEKRTRIIGTHG